MRVRYLLIAATALLLAGGLAFVWLAPSALTQAPTLTVTTLTGETLRIPAARGGPLLVNFWATSCPGCIKEMPHLIELHEEFSPRGLEIIGIAMAYDPPNRVVALTEAKRLPYPIALDIRGEAAKAFGDVRLTPASFLIAANGRIIHQQVGQLDVQRFRALIVEALTNINHPSKQMAKN